MSSTHQSRSAFGKVVGISAACAMLVCGLAVVPTAGAATTGDDPDIATILKGSKQITAFDFNSVSDGQTGSIAGTNGYTAQINGTAKTAKGSDGSTAVQTGSGFWLSVKGTDGSSPLKGQHAVTISYDSKANQTNQGWAFYAAPSATAQDFGKEHYLGFMDKTDNVTVERYNNTDGRKTDANVAGKSSGQWKHVDVVETDDTAYIYINGKLAGTSTQTRQATLPDILGNNGGILQLGKANWGNGEYFTGQLDNLTVYDSTIPAVGAQWPKVGSSLPSTATKDFAVEPSSLDGVPLTWSSDNSAITIEHNSTAKVTRPAAGSPDAVVRLTVTREAATINGHSYAQRQKTFTVTVPHIPSPKDDATADLTAAMPEDPSDIRSNFSLGESGSNGSTITWALKDKGDADFKITDGQEGYNGAYKRVTVTRPASGKSATHFTVTGTATLPAQDSSSQPTVVTKDVTFTVQPMPAKAGKTDAYVWAFFTGEGVGGERISLAASKGNNALDWNTLNNGQPLFTSTLGEKGLRDPFIMRSHDGDKFYLLATDLKISGRANCPVTNLSSFAGSQSCGSRGLEIWESDDLVHWGKQRHVTVSAPDAGNTWAPEAYWDDAIGKYVVYWASNIFDSDDATKHNPLTYNRLMIAETDDFVHFTKPTKWVDVNRNRSGQGGSGSIDATVQKDGDWYYRVYKDERTMTLRQERSKNLLTSMAATTSNTAQQEYANALENQRLANGLPATGDNAWQQIATNIGKGADGYNGHFGGQGEGPSLFKANDGDVNGYKWYLFIDQPNYHHNQEGNAGPNHYVPFATNDLSSGKWTGLADKMPESQFPTLTDGGRPRHGTVIPVTRAQYKKVLEAYAPSIAVEKVDPLTATTEQGTAPTLPKTATLTMKDGSTKTVDVKWDAVDASKYAEPGTVRVSGTAQDDSREPVEAVVTVTAKPKDLALEDKSGSKISALDMEKQSDRLVKVTVSPDSPVTWSSSDPSVATVEATSAPVSAARARLFVSLARVDSATYWAKVTALKKGTTTITATTADGRHVSMQVNVSDPSTPSQPDQPGKPGEGGQTGDKGGTTAPSKPASKDSGRKTGASASAKGAKGGLVNTGSAVIGIAAVAAVLAGLGSAVVLLRRRHADR